MSLFLFLSGGLQVVADLIHLDQEMYGMQNDPINMALRRYAGMALTNLTFGDVVNKVQKGTVRRLTDSKGSATIAAPHSLHSFNLPFSEWSL